jgi:hypothetical protein
VGGVKCDSGIGRATDAHGRVLQVRDSLSAGVRCDRSYILYPSLDSCVGVRVGTDGADGTRRKKYGGKQKRWGIEEETK